MKRFRRAESKTLPCRTDGRRAFTLVELLVVIGIVAVLLSVVGVASVRVIRGAREAATRTTIKKIDEMLSRRTAAFERALSGRQLAGGGEVESELLRKYEAIPDSPMKGKRLFIKFFGASFGEPVSRRPASVKSPWWTSDLGRLDDSPSPVPLNGSELAELVTEGKFIPSAHNLKPETESSEMLYWTLVNGPTFGADAVEADSFSSSEVADTDGDGLLEFIDAWGNPLRFYRWPTRLLRPARPGGSMTPPSGEAYFPLGPATAGNELSSDAPATFLIGSLPTYQTKTAAADDDVTDPATKPATKLGQDGDDEFGELFAYYVREGGFSSAVAAARQFETDYHTMNTWHAPLILSIGPDEDPGLFEPTDRANFGHLAQPKFNSDNSAYSEALQDNITNLNSRASGTGGQ